MNNISFKKPIKHWLLEWCPKNKWKLFLSCFGLSRYTLLGRDLELSAVRLLRAGIIWCDSVHWSMSGFWKTKFLKCKILKYFSPSRYSPPPLLSSPCSSNFLSTNQCGLGSHRLDFHNLFLSLHLFWRGRERSEPPGQQLCANPKRYSGDLSIAW